MSYGSVVCPRCHGEVKVYVDTDGFEGTCPTCGKFIGVGKEREPIADKGARFDVYISEDTLVNGEWVRTTTHKMIRTYVTKEQAEEAYEKLHDPEGKIDGKHRTWAMVLKRNNGLAEWYLPTIIRGCRI